MYISGLMEDQRGESVADCCKYAGWRLKKSVAIQVTVFFLSIVGILSLSYMGSMNSHISLLQRLSHSLYPTADPLGAALEKASMGNKNLIIIALNKAYSAKDGMLDLFLQSLHEGEGTEHLIQNFLVAAFDEVAFNQCEARGLHCYKVITDGVDFSCEQSYMSRDYIRMMWRRTLFLTEVLSRGYSFIFSDVDMVWLRNPWPRLISPDDDILMSCDRYSGQPYATSNAINSGFCFMRSNKKTIKLYDLLYESGNIFTTLKEQDVLELFKSYGVFNSLGLKIRYLDTLYFSGFCQKSNDLREVITLHANCIVGIKSKMDNLRKHFDAWKAFMASSSHTNSTGSWP